MTILFSNSTANGASPNTHVSTGGQHVISTTGTFDGASVSIQIRSMDDPNNEWVTNKTYVAAGNDPLTFLPNGYEARGFIANAGGSTSIFMEVRT